MKRITTRAQLVELADELGVRPDWHEPDWHEPDEQEVNALVFGKSFDNAGFWGHHLDHNDSEEIYVVLYHMTSMGKIWTPIAAVNLATLFAWATGYDSDDPS